MGASEWQMPVDPAQPPAASTDEVDETATDRVARLLGEVSSDARAKVSLYRVDAATKKTGWCEDYSVAEFEEGGMSMVRSKWGPGEYVLRLYGMSPNGKAGKPGYVVLAAPRVVIEAAQGAPSAPTAQPAHDLVRVLEAMQASQQSFQQQMVQVLSERPDPMASLRDSISLMTMMREAMGINGAPQKSSIMEAVEAVRTLRDVSGEFAGDGKAEESSMALVGPILGLVQTAMQQRAVSAEVQQPQRVVRADALTAPASAPVASALPAPTAAETDDDEDEMNKLAALMLRAQLKALFKLAARDAPIDEGVDFVCDKLPENLGAALELPTWFDELAALVPEALPHRDWLTKVRDAYLALPVDDAEDSPSV